ncbi:Ubiquitin interaction motif family protein [Reticulomyxa filosa]|uniref:Ubiquitin interaction motif family protein n=1 Tax=Reticulomyxa filosa TaxID=46433 RepID=X6PCB3_RETFI|nr:Ubiquitin interaction motif family protein [Reticulomyxa filosa]|eukprot:ETO35743.1 Ubiquitin interaction motif family protein [Reticulomyxa filosa]
MFEIALHNRKTESINSSRVSRNHKNDIFTTIPDLVTRYFQYEDLDNLCRELQLMENNRKHKIQARQFNKLNSIQLKCRCKRNEQKIQIVKVLLKKALSTNNKRRDQLLFERQNEILLKIQERERKKTPKQHPTPPLSARPLTACTHHTQTPVEALKQKQKMETPKRKTAGRKQAENDKKQSSTIYLYKSYHVIKQNVRKRPQSAQPHLAKDKNQKFKMEMFQHIGNNQKIFHFMEPTLAQYLNNRLSDKNQLCQITKNENFN